MASMFSKYNPLDFARKIFGGTEQGEDDNPHSFNTHQEREEAYESVKRGTSMVPMHKIIGSVGRYHDFDNQFKTRNGRRDERLDTIVEAMKTGKTMAPISLYQIKDDYFILDGHHRFKAAQELGRTEIRSCIIELLPSKNTLENKLYLEKTEFRDKAGLLSTIDLTELGQYGHLEKQIEEHRRFLTEERREEVSYEEAAGDWYSTIYQPLAAIIRDRRLVASFPERTVDDLYLYISVHQWEIGKKRKYGIGVDQLIPREMEEFRKEMSRRKEQKYPDLHPEMTVFILLNVDGRHEQRIFDKLLALDEVREVHSVHGSIDIIIKVRLVRDLLSSDAELLSQFILSTIRKWTGVISTQTLIPGISKVKDTDRCHI
ncbi:Lrp/AsnC ligand binding domain-containing protein [Desulfopila inferna]|uniref:Lrp/AsnC ligand binding domain-containing protein n=1 Tax=Desulfopila inferna TaxID=468528 RepID=UPI00196610A6|nr:Lrp/AsnC ligand binding domain-containing protein [Desulfopila inferna]MBM9605361.1 ParB N-terminal domain-containing protein [Desulfopila inferna]